MNGREGRRSTAHDARTFGATAHTTAPSTVKLVLTGSVGTLWRPLTESVAAAPDTRQSPYQSPGLASEGGISPLDHSNRPAILRECTRAEAIPPAPSPIRP